MYYKKKSKNITMSTDELLDDYNIPITPPHGSRSESPPPRPVKLNKNPRLYSRYVVKRPHLLITLTLLIIFVGVLSCQFIYNFGKSEIQKVSKDKKSILTVSAEDKKRSILTRLKNLPNTFENKF